ncbi:MAG: hypothetical protein ACI8TQ_003309 [Planctomycetota bacterium]|jgi:hypothetical protein
MNASTRPLHKKLVAILIGLVAGVVLGELGLRCAGWISYALSGRGEEANEAGLTILCHGDSNAFGLWETPEASYPGQLQTLLDTREAGTPYQVVNLAVPGLGSTHILDVIDGELERVKPDVVLLTIGANDAWAWKPAAGIDYLEPPFWDDFRLVKVWRLYEQRRREARGELDLEPRVHADAELIEETEERGKTYTFKNRQGEELLRFNGEQTVNRPSDALLLPNLEKNLKRLHEIIGDRLVLVGYGSHSKTYGQANPILRRTSEELGIPFVEPAPRVAELVSRVGFGDVFYADYHPRALGYEVIARMAYNKLVDLGIASGPPLEDPLENLSKHERHVPPVQLVGTLDTNDLAIEIKNEQAGRDFILLLWDLHTDGPDPPIRPYFEIAESDPIFRWCHRTEGMHGTFDKKGNARISLQPLLDLKTESDDPIGTRFRAGYMITISKTDRRLSRFSEGVMVEIR